MLKKIKYILIRAQNKNEIKNKKANFIFFYFSFIFKKFNSWQNIKYLKWNIKTRIKYKDK